LGVRLAAVGVAGVGDAIAGTGSRGGVTGAATGSARFLVSGADAGVGEEVVFEFNGAKRASQSWDPGDVTG